MNQNLLIEELENNILDEDGFISDEYEYVFISDDRIEFGDNNNKCHYESTGFFSIGLSSKEEIEDVIQEWEEYVLTKRINN